MIRSLSRNVVVGMFLLLTFALGAMVEAAQHAQDTQTTMADGASNTAPSSDPLGNTIWG